MVKRIATFLRESRGQTHLWFSRWLGNDVAILVFGAMIGAVGGAAAASFGFLVEYAARLAWGGDVNAVVGRTWLSMVLMVAVPALGGWLVGFIQVFLAKSGPTHGIPEVVAAIVRRQGRIPSSVGLWKALTAAITLGSGGCAGLEGPVVTVGATAGSRAGRLIGARAEDLPILVSCGMAAAVAAAFNAPIAGVLFVLEVILCDFSLRLFMPIVVASVAGIVASQGLREAVFSVHASGNGALFLADSLTSFRPTLAEAPVYILLGILCGFLGFAITGLLHKSEGWWKRVPGPAWLRPGWGGLMLGMFGLAFAFAMPYADHMFHALSGQGLPAFMGNGYGVIESLFKPGHFEGPSRYAAGMLCAIVAFKIAGVGMTIGSGGSGGAIAPSLFIGAAGGACVGCMAQATGWFPHMTPATYALVGMAGVIASAFRCPLTAFVLVFELTHDYAMIPPAMVVSILAVTVARRMSRESLVTQQLRELGVRTGQGAAALRRTLLAEIPLAPAHRIGIKDSVATLIGLVSLSGEDDFVVLDVDGKYQGMVYGDVIRRLLLDRDALPLIIVEDIIQTSVHPLSPTSNLDQVMERFSESGASSLPVADDSGHIIGLITHERLMSQYHRIVSGD